MSTKVHMEALSPTMEEGQIVSWLKAEGDEVSEGDILAEIETDKATMELVARGSGVLRKHFLGEGSTAPVGAVIGVIAGPDEDIADVEAEAASGGGPAEAGAEASATAGGEAGEAAGGAAGAAAAAAAEGVAGGQGPTEKSQAAEGAVAASEAPGRPATPRPSAAPASGADAGEGADAGGNGAGGRLKVSPLARRLAAENDLDLGSVAGSGPGGRIVKRDIEAALEGGATAAAAAPAAAAPSGASTAAAAVPGRPTPQAEEVVEVPVSQMRKTIAKRLSTSLGPVPTFYLTIEADMQEMTAMRKRLNERLEPQGVKVSVNDLVIKAVAAALRRHPEVNAAWGESVIRRYGRVHIGVAVAVEEGLITPVVRDADAKGVAEIGQEVRELAGRAREKKLQPDEYTGATFSISNLGMFGIDEFTAIINPPEAAILAVGRVEEKPVVMDGEVVVRPRMRLTMSCDHRVVDGATGARFLQTLKEFLEEPMMMLA